MLEDRNLQQVWFLIKFRMPLLCYGDVNHYSFTTIYNHFKYEKAETNNNILYVFCTGFICPGNYRFRYTS